MYKNVLGPVVSCCVDDVLPRCYQGKRFDVRLNIRKNNNNVHLSCAHQRPERSHDTY